MKWEGLFKAKRTTPGVIRLLKFSVIHGCQSQTPTVIPQITYFALYSRLVRLDSFLARPTRIFKSFGARIMFDIAAE